MTLLWQKVTDFVLKYWQILKFIRDQKWTKKKPKNSTRLQCGNLPSSSRPPSNDWQMCQPVGCNAESWHALRPQLMFRLRADFIMTSGSQECLFHLLSAATFDLWPHYCCCCWWCWLLKITEPMSLRAAEPQNIFLNWEHSPAHHTHTNTHKHTQAEACARPAVFNYNLWQCCLFH